MVILKSSDKVIMYYQIYNVINELISVRDAFLKVLLLSQKNYQIVKVIRNS